MLKEWKILLAVLFLCIAGFTFSASKRRKLHSSYYDDYDSFIGDLNLGDVVYIDDVVEMDPSLDGAVIDEIEVQCSLWPEEGKEEVVEISGTTSEKKCEKNQYVKMVFPNDTDMPMNVSLFGERQTLPYNVIKSYFNTGASAQRNVIVTDTAVIIDTDSGVYWFYLDGTPLNFNAYAGTAVGASVVTNGKLFVSNGANINVYDTTSQTSLGTFAITNGNQVFAMQVGLDGLVYAQTTDGLGSYVEIISPITQAVVGSILYIGEFTFDISITPLSGNYITFATSVNIYNIQTNPTQPGYQGSTTVGAIGSGFPSAMNQSIDGSFTVIGTTTGEVYLVNTINDSLEATSALAGNIRSIAYSAGVIYVAKTGPSDIDLLDSSNLSFINSFAVTNIYRCSVATISTVYFQSGTGSATSDILAFASGDTVSSPTVINTNYTNGSTALANTISANGSGNVVSVDFGNFQGSGYDSPLLTPENISQFTQVAFNPIEICGIRLQSTTNIQLNNELIFRFRNIQGTHSEFKIIPSIYVATAQTQNIVYFDEFPPGLVLDSQQSIVYTVNPRTSVTLFVYARNQVQMADTIGATKFPQGDLLGKMLDDDEFYYDEVEIILDEDEEFYIG